MISALMSSQFRFRLLLTNSWNLKELELLISFRTMITFWKRVARSLASIPAEIMARSNLSAIDQGQSFLSANVIMENIRYAIINLTHAN